MSDSVQSHRRQPTRLSRPWDSLRKNIGVGCHFLLQCMKVKSESEVTQSCLTLGDPMDCSLPDSPVHGIFWARVLEWVPLPSPYLKWVHRNSLSSLSAYPFYVRSTHTALWYIKCLYSYFLKTVISGKISWRHTPNDDEVSCFRKLSDRKTLWVYIQRGYKSKKCWSIYWVLILWSVPRSVAL